MRTNIEIDERLIRDAMAASGLTTKKATIEAALKQYVRLAAQSAAIEGMRGIGWEGDLDEMRNDWTPDTDWGLKDERP